MNRAEYNEILKNIKEILRNPNGNFGKLYLTGSDEENAETLKNAEACAAAALIAADEFYAYLSKKKSENGINK